MVNILIQYILFEYFLNRVIRSEKPFWGEFNIHILHVLLYC